MNFITFLQYFIASIIILEVGLRILFWILIWVLTPQYHYEYKRKTPVYARSKTEPKLFPDHKTGELKNKLGDLSPKYTKRS